MNKIIVLKMILLLSFGILYGQAQQHVWYLQDQEIDFTTDIPTISPINPIYGAGGSGGSFNTGNGIHDINGNKILSVYNSQVFSNSGLIGVLDHMDIEVDGADIIPKPGSPCGYYIVYSSTFPFPCTDCEGYCGSEFTYNKFYTEVDMSLNYGQGELVGTNGIEVSACNDYTPNPIAVSRELPDGNRYLYLLSNRQIKRYLVSPSGIQFQSVIGEYGFLGDVQSIELELSADGTKLACADISAGVNAYVFHLDPTTGTIIPTAGNNGDGSSEYTIPSIRASLTGVEFSQNGFNLFVGSAGEGIYHINTVTESVVFLEGSYNYGDTQLELAYHPDGFHKIYGVSFFDPDRLGYIDDIETLSPSFVPDIFDEISAYDDSYITEIWQISLLPNQIDGEDYTARFSYATGACCATVEGFDIVKYTATSSAVWSPGDNPFGGITSVKVAQEIRIPNDVTIEIQDMDFLFNEDAKVIIEQGGKLVLKNSLFSTLDCEGLLWKGIQVWGNSAEAQTYSDQGWVIMHNSTIEHAHVAIDLWNPGHWAETGGVVMAYNSTFRNNRRSANFMNYVHTIGADIEVANKSLFRNVDFIWDNNFRSSPLNHASMYKVTGVRFAGCHFSDDRTDDYFTSPYLDSGSITKCGIRSIDAKYYVNASCSFMDLSDCGDDYESTPWNASSFDNLDFGIYAANSSSIHPIDVKRSVFTNNLYGIYTDALNTPKLILNHFYYTNDNNHYTSERKYGIYLKRTQNIIVEENYFTKTVSFRIGFCRGIFCSDLGENNEMIRRNNFYDLNIANLTEGKNRGTLGPGYPYGSTGLSFECNVNEQNTVDFKVLSTLDGDAGSFNGIKTNIGNYDQAAGNIFSDVSFGHFINGTAHLLKYYWNAEEPLLTSGVTKIFTPFNSQCEPTYPLDLDGGLDWESRFYQVKLVLEPLMQQYDQYVSQGIQPPTQLEDEIIQLNGEKSKLAHSILGSLYVEDDLQLDLALVEHWIQLDDDFLVQMQLIDLYIQKLDFGMAYNEINNLISSITSTTSQTTQQEINDFVKLKKVIISTLTQDNSLANISPNTKMKIQNIAANGTGIAKNQAQELLCFFFEECESTATNNNLNNPYENLIMNEILESEFNSLTPNPTSGIMTLYIQNIEGIYQVEIYNLQGQLIKSLETSGSSTEIDLSNLNNGIYLVKASNGMDSFTKRVVKM